MAVSVTQIIAFITISLAITIANVCVFDVSLAEAGTDGFSVELIHRDSPKSPSYNQLKQNEAQSTIVRSGADPEYLMQISIGTPPRKFWGSLDTRSNLIWTQCTPCIKCNAQKDPLFDPKASSTYQVVPGRSAQCVSVGGVDNNDGICHYSLAYDEGRYTRGILSLDTITLDSTNNNTSFSLPRTLFGCGNDNVGNFNNQSSGRIGFGSGQNSLISQLGSSAGGRFSYCLSSNPKSSSKLNFGTNAVVEGLGVVSTRLIPDNSNYYYLIIEAISVGDERLNYTGIGDSGNGNIVIDTKTSYSVLPQGTYRVLEAKVSQAIHLPRLNSSNQPGLCFKTESDIADPPVITIHFEGGADVKLSYSNTFDRISRDVVCLAFFDTENFPVYGNFQQTNFLIGYDLQGKTLSFKPTDCTK